MSSYDPNKVTYFAETDFRNKKTPFGIKADDRTRHIYIIGKTGMGKSTLLENMAVQDIWGGEGMAFMDPHGKTAELLLDYIPPERRDDVLYFAPFDVDNPVSFNIMEDVGYDKRHLVVAGLMSAFKKIWQDAWSARMEYILTNTLLALLEYPDATLLAVNRMYTDKEYRKKVVAHVTDPSVRSFWVDEYAKYTDRYTQDATPAIQNKVGQFTSNPIIRNIIGQPKSSFDVRQMMDNKKIMIINLSKGRIGEANANLLGSMLVTKIYLSAMSRADLSGDEIRKLPNFYLYVDEFQSFANESFADILSEARKYNLALTLAHQYIEQMPEEVRAAVFGNVGTMISFRVGAFDSEILEKEFNPVFTAEDMVNLGFTQIYLKLMIDGVSSHPFSATTLPPLPLPPQSYRNDVIERSKRNFAKPRNEVEQAINDWYKPIEEEKSAPALGAPASSEHMLPRKPRRALPEGNEAPASEPRHAPERRNSDERRGGERRAQPERRERVRNDRRHSDDRRVHVPPAPEFDKPAEEEVRASLDMLKRKPTRGVQEVKEVGPSKHLEGLRAALADVLADGKADKEEKKQPSESQASNPQDKQKQTYDRTERKQEVPQGGHKQEEQTKEVPRDVLEKMFNGS